MKQRYFEELRLKICIAGKNDIAVNALLYLTKELGYKREDIFAVLNKTDDGIGGWQKSFKKCAESLNVKIVKLEDVYEIEDLIFLSLEFDRIIKTEKFKTKKLYNIHFSNLPKYKGMYTSVMPILKGEKTAGVTLHKIDNGIDTGDIIAQRLFDIDINDTARDLYFKYLDNAFLLFKENILKLVNEDFEAKKQDACGSSYYSKKEIDFKNIEIDLNKTSFEIHNQIRAFIFKEYQLPVVEGLRIIKSVLSNEFIGRNFLEKTGEKLIISGIDGYKITAEICAQSRERERERVKGAQPGDFLSFVLSCSVLCKAFLERALFACFALGRFLKG